MPFNTQLNSCLPNKTARFYTTTPFNTKKPQPKPIPFIRNWFDKQILDWKALDIRLLTKDRRPHCNRNWYKVLPICVFTSLNYLFQNADDADFQTPIFADFFFITIKNPCHPRCLHPCHLRSIFSSTIFLLRQTLYQKTLGQQPHSNLNWF